jgi:hypothetical protein
MNYPPDPNPNSLTRRRFLHQGLAGAALLGGLRSVPVHAASARDNPFSYNLDRYRKIDPKWLHYEKVGSFPSPRPEPRRMAIDRQDRVYIAAGREVVVLDRAGIPSGEMICDAPIRCVAVAADGARYLGFKDHVEVFDAKGQRTARWEPVAGRPFLTGLAADENNVFVADAGNRVVLRYDRSGALLGRIGERNRDRGIPGLVVPSACLDVEIAPDGLLRVNNPGRHRVEAYTFDGHLELFWGRASAAIDGFCGCCNPVNLELLADGSCVTFEKGLPRVKVYRPDGQLDSVVAGPEHFADPGNISPALDSEGAPAGVLDGAVDSQGRIYTLDIASRRVDILQRKAEPQPATAGPGPI